MHGIPEKFIDKQATSIRLLLDKIYYTASGDNQTYDEEFLNQLRENVDPCSEFGEFHRFCHDGPINRKPVPYILGETVLKTYDIKKDGGCKDKKGFFFIEVFE
jgi:hypothetical protein